MNIAARFPQEQDAQADGRMCVEERLDALTLALSGPLPNGERKQLRTEYLNLTDELWRLSR